MAEAEKGVSQRDDEMMRRHLRQYHGAKSVKPWMVSSTVVSVYDDDSRPDPSSVDAGTAIFNVSDNALNVSDGTNWRDGAGDVT